MAHLKRVKVFVDQLQVGMFVSELDRDWGDTNFLLQGFTIQDEEDIAAVQRQCQYVYVDFPNEGLYKQFRARHSASPTIRQKFQQDLEQHKDLIAELKTARQTVRQSKKLVKGLLDRIMLGEEFEIATVREQVKECVKSIVRNENAMLMMTLLKNKDDYTAEHCLNVGILSIAFGKFLGLSDEQLEDLGIAGMLHDVGKVKVPSHILNKPNSLTEDEMQQMKQHAQHGYELLLSKRDVTPMAIDVAYSHHERLNGEGYPRGLKNEQISLYSRIVAIVDTFDAITSDRCYDGSRGILEAYKVLMDGRDSHYDAKLVTQFIEWRGIYPPGSIVEMDNGEVGIVIGTNQKHKLRPKVLMVLDELKQKRRSERVIDMSKLDLDATAHTYRIRKAIPNRAFGIDLQQYVDRGLKISAV